jgi:hypothetical protein
MFPASPFVRLGTIPSFAVAGEDKRFLMLREGESTQESELIVALTGWRGSRGRAASSVGATCRATTSTRVPPPALHRSRKLVPLDR